MKTKENILYVLGIIVPTLAIAGIAAGVIYITSLLKEYEPDYAKIGIVVAACVLLFALSVFMNGIRRKYRQLASVDENGLPRKKYRDLSKQERMIVDIENMQANQHALPEQELIAMTHKGSKDPDGDLDSLIGLKSVKKKVKELKAKMIYGNDSTRVPLKACFLGEPGTGKTTVVSIMTAYLYKYKMIKKNEFISVNGASFESSNDPVRRMQLILANAKGRVLFIDEAYALAYSRMGKQLLTLLMNDMEEKRNRMALILAGYKDEMKKLFNMNPGLASRIDSYIFFDNYTPNEMLKIEKKMAQDRGYHFTEEALEATIPVFMSYAEKGVFANARTARQIVEDAISQHTYNLMTGELYEKDLLTEMDIVANKDALEYLSE